MRTDRRDFGEDLGHSKLRDFCRPLGIHGLWQAEEPQAQSEVRDVEPVSTEGQAGGEEEADRPSMPIDPSKIT